MLQEQLMLQQQAAVLQRLEITKFILFSPLQLFVFQL
jgi:hypothetical protein